MVDMTESGWVAAVPENPCDYSCQGNPSGLFEDPRGGSWFIQCGDSMEEGEACRCCEPYFLRCPNGTAFDPRTRVCSEHTDSSSDQKQYTVINWEIPDILGKKYTVSNCLVKLSFIT